jgi:hypothetical protein
VDVRLLVVEQRAHDLLDGQQADDGRRLAVDDGHVADVVLDLFFDFGRVLFGWWAYGGRACLVGIGVGVGAMRRSAIMQRRTMSAIASVTVSAGVSTRTRSRGVMIARTGVVKLLRPATTTLRR